MKIKSTGFIILVAAAIGLSFWFGLERLIFYAYTHSLWPNHWVEVQLADGRTFYGQLGAVTSAEIELKNPYYLEKFRPEPTAAGQTLPGASSDSFSVGGQISAPPLAEQKFVLVPEGEPIIFSRGTIVFWTPVGPGEEVSRYLH